MTRLIVIHYSHSIEGDQIPPHVVLAARDEDGKFTQIGHVGGGAVSALRLIGVSAVSRPGHEIFGADAFQPPHFFGASDFFAAPQNFIGYHPQFLGLDDMDEWEPKVRTAIMDVLNDEVDGYLGDREERDGLTTDIIDKLPPQAEMFGYGLPIQAITVQTIEDLPRGGERTEIVEG